ncbi:hypothetical protein BDK92_7330 [Micromonospora pisi]|uniref:Uncharacterized protein n=1 Tax=Micromonospora pisi TaxID=589240 RepID=A0A495JW90_9ACTN|nr:hypothetical protein [Micromonospora pisi]RKR92848.1 hypothetical protein BDK92_7330 [Micromonospora pisi]
MSTPTPTTVLRWEDPPSAAQTKEARWAPIAAELRANPNRWACIHEGDSTEASGLVAYIKKGAGPFAPAGEFEVCSRSQPRVQGSPIRVGVYARFLKLRDDQ